MKRLLAAGAVGLVLAGWTAVGAQADPGPNGKNDRGLCTAAQSGNKNGWTDGALPPPFAGAPDGDDAGNAPGGRQDFIDAFCADFPPPPGQAD